MFLEDLEKEILKKDTITSKILTLFKEHKGDILTADEILKAIDIKYTTAWGIICRLNRMGLIKKEARGKYSYAVDKRWATLEDVKKEEVVRNDEEQNIIERDFNEKILTFKNESEREIIRLNALKDIWWLSGNFQVAHNEELIDLINTLPSQKVAVQEQLIAILSKIFDYEFQFNKEKNKKVVIEKCFKTVKEIVLSNTTDRSIRISAMSILTNQIGGMEVTDIFFEIVRGDEQTWEDLIQHSYPHYISHVANDDPKHRRYFLIKINELLKDDDETYTKRAEMLYEYIRNNYYLRFHCPEIVKEDRLPDEAFESQEVAPYITKPDSWL